MTSRTIWGLGLPFEHPIWQQIREREALEGVNYTGLCGDIPDQTDADLDAEIERLRREVARKRKREEIERLRRELSGDDPSVYL